MINIPITYNSDNLIKKTQLLAQKWQFEFLPPEQIEQSAPTFYMQLTDKHLQLVEFKGKTKPLFIDFNAGNYRHRRLFGGGKNQLIGKAIGLNKGFTPHVLDATAGLGRDAFVMASLGCEVTMLERTNILASLLEDALTQAELSDEIIEIGSRLELIYQDSIKYFTELDQQESNQAIDIIYLDPMYPDKKGTALVKKEMQFLQQLVGKDMDADMLLEKALAHAKYRVVVKRPKSAEFMMQKKPELQLSEKKQRYDIYIKQKLPC